MSVAEKLRALCAQPENDDEDDDMLGDGTAARAKTSLVVEPLPPSKKLRLRAEIPMPMPGKKVNRTELEATPQRLPDSGKENEPARKSDAAANLALAQDIEHIAANRDENMVMVAPQKNAIPSSCSGEQLQRQLDLYRRLLAIRIQLEQPLKAAHRLPQRHMEEHDEDIGAMQAQAWKLFDSLVAIQGRKRGPAAEHLKLKAWTSRKRQRDETWSELEERHETAFSWALDIFDDVKEKTKLEARKGFKVLEQSLSKQLNAALASDTAWMKKCHPQAGVHEVIGGSTTSKDALYDPAIYDDHDFYSSMLKDIIQRGAPAGEKGTMNKKPAKARDVERRASKGRKIRYVAIEKLQNFMAPAVRQHTIDPHTADQLMGCLFQ